MTEGSDESESGLSGGDGSAVDRGEDCCDAKSWKCVCVFIAAGRERVIPAWMLALLLDSMSLMAARSTTTTGAKVMS